MARAGRLTSAEDFRRTYAEGKRASGKQVVVYVRTSDDARPARIGISAARGLGGAVERNRAKRRIREAARRLREEIKPGADVVIVAGASATHGSFQNMVDSVRRMVAKAGGCR